MSIDYKSKRVQIQKKIDELTRELKDINDAEESETRTKILSEIVKTFEGKNIPLRVAYPPRGFTHNGDAADCISLIEDLHTQLKKRNLDSTIEIDYNCGYVYFTPADQNYFATESS